MTIVSDPNAVDPGSTTSPSVGTIRYMAPELLNPSAFGMKNNYPTERSDIYSFGVVTFQVSIACRISPMIINTSAQVVTGEQPFSGVREDAIAHKVVGGERPTRPPGPSEWLSDDVWNFISSCLSSSLDSRPDLDSAVDLLDDAADAVEAGREGSCAASGQGKRTSYGGSSASYWLYQSWAQVKRSQSASTALSKRRVDDAPAQSSPSPPQIPAIPCPFIVRTPPDHKARKQERKSKPHLFSLLSALTTLLKNDNRGSLGHGTTPPAFTGAKPPWCTTMPGSFTSPHLTAGC